jgi:hypothetical protein
MALRFDVSAQKILMNIPGQGQKEWRLRNAW